MHLSLLFLIIPLSLFNCCSHISISQKYQTLTRYIQERLLTFMMRESIIILIITYIFIIHLFRDTNVTSIFYKSSQTTLKKDKGSTSLSLSLSLSIALFLVLWHHTFFSSSKFPTKFYKNIVTFMSSNKYIMKICFMKNLRKLI
jgi:hypothetical protein